MKKKSTSKAPRAKKAPQPAKAPRPATAKAPRPAKAPRVDETTAESQDMDAPEPLLQDMSEGSTPYTNEND